MQSTEREEGTVVDTSLLRGINPFLSGGRSRQRAQQKMHKISAFARETWWRWYNML